MLLLDDEFVKASAMAEELKLEFAIWLYEKDRVSLRKAAKMVGLPWLDFSEKRYSDCEND